jgi:hypothetical protein
MHLWHLHICNIYIYATNNNDGYKESMLHDFTDILFDYDWPEYLNTIHKGSKLLLQNYNEISVSIMQLFYEKQNFLTSHSCQSS